MLLLLEMAITDEKVEEATRETNRANSFTEQIMVQLSENKALGELHSKREWATTLLAVASVAYLVITLSSLVLLSCKAAKQEDIKALETNYQQEIEQLMKTAKKEDRGTQRERQENVQDKLELTELMENSRKTSYTQRQKTEIKELNLIRAIAYLSLIASCVFSPLLELHTKFCIQSFREMEATVAKLEA